MNRKLLARLEQFIHVIYLNSLSAAISRERDNKNLMSMHFTTHCTSKTLILSYYTKSTPLNRSRIMDLMHCVTIASLQLFRSSIFPCLSVCQLQISVTRPNLQCFNILKAYKPYTDPVPSSSTKN